MVRPNSFFSHPTSFFLFHVLLRTGQIHFGSLPLRLRASLSEGNFSFACRPDCRSFFFFFFFFFLLLLLLLITTDSYYVARGDSTDWMRLSLQDSTECAAVIDRTRRAAVLLSSFFCDAFNTAPMTPVNAKPTDPSSSNHPFYAARRRRRWSRDDRPMDDKKLGKSCRTEGDFNHGEIIWETSKSHRGKPDFFDEYSGRTVVSTGSLLASLLFFLVCSLGFIRFSGFSHFSIYRSIPLLLWIERVRKIKKKSREKR